MPKTHVLLILIFEIFSIFRVFSRRKKKLSNFLQPNPNCMMTICEKKIFIVCVFMQKTHTHWKIWWLLKKLDKLESIKNVFFVCLSNLTVLHVVRRYWAEMHLNYVSSLHAAWILAKRWQQDFPKCWTMPPTTSNSMARFYSIQIKMNI